VGWFNGWLIWLQGEQCVYVKAEVALLSEGCIL
jgi:hypothetical protein